MYLQRYLRDNIVYELSNILDRAIVELTVAHIEIRSHKFCFILKSGEISSGNSSVIKCRKNLISMRQYSMYESVRECSCAREHVS